MALICPTVLAATPSDFERQIDRIAAFAQRIQIDLSDGDFAATKTINLIQAWWPKDIEADLHLMYAKPHEHIETIVSLRPSLVILHAEAEGDVGAVMKHLQKCGLKVGIALLPETEPDQVAGVLQEADHALIFSGNLGHFGGVANLSLLGKVPEIKAINPKIEIGWDGGANAATVADLVKGGVDVINVGGAIQRSDEPEKAYATLEAKLPK